MLRFWRMSDTGTDYQRLTACRSILPREISTHSLFGMFVDVLPLVNAMYLCVLMMV